MVCAEKHADAHARRDGTLISMEGFEANTGVLRALDGEGFEVEWGETRFTEKGNVQRAVEPDELRGYVGVENSNEDLGALRHNASSERTVRAAADVERRQRARAVEAEVATSEGAQT